MVAEEFPEVLLIRNESNVGYPAANNRGLEALGFAQDGADAPRYALLLDLAAIAALVWSLMVTYFVWKARRRARPADDEGPSDRGNRG